MHRLRLEKKRMSYFGLELRTDSASSELAYPLYNSFSKCMLSPPDFDLFPRLKKPLRGKGFRSIEEVSNEVT
jgi:hypothetical protein